MKNSLQNTLELIGRKSLLFKSDIEIFENELHEQVSESCFLVVGGAGTIGQAVVKEIFKRNPKKLHVVDISENNLVELVRDLRSSYGYGTGDFKTYAIDCGSFEFEALLQSQGPYDYIFNLSALKHVRSEKDPFTLMRMTMVNVINSIKMAQIARDMNVKKYFCVSTDKAANPVNMMGASKRIMELFLLRESDDLNISMARFANVAFSDGSLLHGFNQRLIKNQPISTPNDIRRYFLLPQESGELCLLSGILGKNKENFFPKLDKGIHLISFSEITKRYLHQNGFKCFECKSETEARDRSTELIQKGFWPCHFFQSDTTGEKKFEEFFLDDEKLDTERFQKISIIENKKGYDQNKLDKFLESLELLRKNNTWNKSDILELYYILLPDFCHIEMGKSLDEKM